MFAGVLAMHLLKIIKILFRAKKALNDVGLSVFVSACRFLFLHVALFMWFSLYAVLFMSFCFYIVLFVCDS